MKKILLYITITFFGINASSQVVAEYDFNNSYNNSLGNTPFASGTGLSFVADRFGNTDSALNINAAGTTATILNLPVGNSARTISIWVKSNMTANSSTIFSYGNSSANAAFGFGKYTTTTSSGGIKPIITTKTDFLLYGYANDLAWSEPVIPVNWNHFAVTYNGSIAAIYMNGVLQASGTKAWNTANTVFRLGLDTSGGASFVGAIDELKIYNSALTASEIMTLYNSIDTTPVISEIYTTYFSPNTQISYLLNASGSATTAVINYGTSASTLTNQIASGTASGVISINLTNTINGLIEGATYYYQIVATNSKGTTSSSIGSFINDATAAIAEYKFDNTYNNSSGLEPFRSDTNSSFATDRHGNTASALYLNNTNISAPINSLPVGASARTVSIWVKIPDASTDNHIFFYGDLSVNASYGLSVQGTKLVNFGYGNDLNASNYGISGANWVHVVTTFDGTTAKIYYNGIERASGNKSTWNTWSSDFKLGRDFQLYIDDLKIYNKVLSATEINTMYNSESLSTQNFNSSNLKASIYPNPTSDDFTIETENEIKSVEIYSFLGQKILSSQNKKINVSNFSKGIYMVRIEDINNAITTRKLIVE